MPWTPEILIGNTNTYQIVDLRDALTDDLESGVELYMSICENPDAGHGVITDAINDTPIEITSEDHGLTTGDTVTVVNVGGNGAAKGTFTVTVLDADTFELDDSIGDGDYTGGGQFYKCLEDAGALELTDLGDGQYSVDVDGSIGLVPNTQYTVVFYSLGAFRDVLNWIVRVVARVRGS